MARKITMLANRPIYLAFALSLLANPTLAEDAKRPDPLLGKWRVISVHVDGAKQKVPSDARMSDEIEFRDDKVIGFESDWKVDVSTLQRFPTKQPKEFKRFDAGSRDQRERYLIGIGIYEVSGDTLMWCEVFPDKPLPKDFKTAKGDQRTLVVLKREKAEKPPKPKRAQGERSATKS